MSKKKTPGCLKMDLQDKFFKESLKQIHEKRDAKEENFEIMQQQERAKVQQKNTHPSSNDDLRKRYAYIFFIFQTYRITKYLWI